MAAEKMSISDLLGLDSPGGLLSFSSPYSSPGSGQDLQDFLDDGKFLNGPNGIKNFQRNISLGSAGSSPGRPPYFSKNSRSVSLSDSCGSNNSTYFDPPLNRTLSGSAAGSSDVSSAGIADLLNAMSLTDLLSKNVFGPNSPTDLEISNLQQNLQTLNALKNIQQSPAVLNSILNNSAANGINPIDKWNQSPLPENSHHLDRAARFHRSAASHLTAYDVVCTWSGILPPREDNPFGYSSKVFVGGIPWDTTEQSLMQVFQQYSIIRVEWPGKDLQNFVPKGYAYLVLESEKCVKSLLKACVATNNNFYFKIHTKRMRPKNVQIIPWYLSDSNYTQSAWQKLDPTKTVFVGGLHGMLTAQGLARIMNDLFDGVVYAGIDTDKHKYPIGSGRVTFNNSHSYMKAVSAAFIEIKCSKFSKKVQVDPYLEDSLCSLCSVQQGPYFCRDMSCFRYFCRSCWLFRHGPELSHHSPMTRNLKNQLQDQQMFPSIANNVKSCVVRQDNVSGKF